MTADIYIDDDPVFLHRLQSALERSQLCHTISIEVEANDDRRYDPLSYSGGYRRLEAVCPECGETFTPTRALRRELVLGKAVVARLPIHPRRTHPRPAAG